LRVITISSYHGSLEDEKMTEDAPRLTMKQARAELAAMDHSIRRTGHGDELRIAPRAGTAEQREACAYYTNDLADAVSTARFERSRSVLREGALTASLDRVMQTEPFTPDQQPQGRNPESAREYPGERLVMRLAGRTTQDSTEDRER
jgi:hypothetical protein